MTEEASNQKSWSVTFSLVVVILLAPLWLTLLAFWGGFHLLSSACLHIAVWLLWLPRSKRVLFVYSNSPVWRDYLEQQVLPRIREQAVVLNWSERRRWSHSLALAVFRHFGGNREFNPMAVVFHPLRRAKVYRFFGAFRDFKHGKHAPLTELQRQLFDSLGIADGDEIP